MEVTKLLYDAYKEARTRLQIVIDKLLEEDLSKKIGDCPNSIGFLMRHIGDVELLFSKNVFKMTDVQVKAQTVIDQKDTGAWTNLDELNEYVKHSFKTVLTAIAQQDDQSWEETIETKEFGKKTKAEAFARIISHTAYHAGQLAIIKKYGK
jgi:uncharacterized damage-inducible protein DinB